VITTRPLSKSLLHLKKANGVPHKETKPTQFMRQKSNAKVMKMALINANKELLKAAHTVMMSLSVALLKIFRDKRLSKSIIHKKRKMLSKTGSQLRKRSQNNKKRKK